MGELIPETAVKAGETIIADKLETPKNSNHVQVEVFSPEWDAKVGPQHVTIGIEQSEDGVKWEPAASTACTVGTKSPVVDLKPAAMPSLDYTYRGKPQLFRVWVNSAIDLKIGLTGAIERWQ